VTLAGRGHAIEAAFIDALKNRPIEQQFKRKYCFSRKMLDEHQKLRAAWVIVDATDYFESELLVEGGCLKIVGFNYNLLATPRFGLLLCGAH
jgi:hypothetical protein